MHWLWIVFAFWFGFGLCAVMRSAKLVDLHMMLTELVGEKRKWEAERRREG